MGLSSRQGKRKILNPFAHSRPDRIERVEGAEQGEAEEIMSWLPTQDWHQGPQGPGLSPLPFTWMESALEQHW